MALTIINNGLRLNREGRFKESILCFGLYFKKDEWAGKKNIF